jgi:hypothetical protein
MCRDLFNVHAAFGARNKDRPARVSVHKQTHIEFLRNGSAFLDQQGPNLAAFRSRLVGNQGFPEQLCGKTGHFGAILG